MHYTEYWAFHAPDSRKLNHVGMDLHPESVVTNKNGGRYDMDARNASHVTRIYSDMNRYRTDGRFRKSIDGPTIYSVLPPHATQKPRLVKHSK